VDINLNEIAVNITKEEGKKKETDIAQVKEVMKIFLETLANYSDEQILEVVSRYKK